jgi:ribA/ribD-fused uncharacterized protein
MRVIGNVTAYYSKDDYPSHHYLCNFRVKTVDFTSMEQMMMFSKAMLFGDKEAAHEIMSTQNCQAQKMIGRRVKGLRGGKWDDEDRKLWDEKCDQIVFIGNREKYRQNRVLISLLLLTGDTILVEASKKDVIWGCGLDERDDRIADPKNWTGQNRHGQIQMRVRQYFRDHPEAKKLADNAVLFNFDKD